MYGFAGIQDLALDGNEAGETGRQRSQKRAGEEMYTDYWGLKEKPFVNVFDPRFFYYSEQHEEALARVLYAAREIRGVALLTGAYGTGKTLISRTLVERLNGEEGKTRSILITNPRLSPRELLEEMLFQMGEANLPASKAVLLRTLRSRLMEDAGENSGTAVIVDEAHLIEDVSCFDELRLLLDLEKSNRRIASLILIGHSDLKAQVAKMEQLRQRVVLSFELGPLSREETQGYIEHRLKVAGTEKQLFTPEAYDVIYQKSEGIPRKVNNICHLSLLSGSQRNVEQVDKGTVWDAIDELGEPLG